MRSTFFTIALCGLFAGATQAGAQGCSGNAGTCNTTNTASVLIPALVKLGMSATTTSLTAPTADQVDLGATVSDAGPTFTIKANRSWTLNIKSGNPTNWTYTGANSGVKPIADLTWANAVAGTYAAITASDVVFTNGGGATAGTAAAAFFKTNYPAGFTNSANAPGTYSLPVVFTLTAP
ncbi:MAG: hypothetical protein M3037_10435 [Gemmatimonadota bacterium]|nr:hypothetical protein [Gemmatimonadota bacterium]